MMPKGVVVAKRALRQSDHFFCFISIYCFNFSVDALILYVILCCRYVLVAYIVSMYCISI